MNSLGMLFPSSQEFCAIQAQHPNALFQQSFMEITCHYPKTCVLLLVEIVFRDVLKYLLKYLNRGTNIELPLRQKATSLFKLFESGQMKRAAVGAHRRYYSAHAKTRSKIFVLLINVQGGECVSRVSVTQFCDRSHAGHSAAHEHAPGSKVRKMLVQPRTQFDRMPRRWRETIDDSSSTGRRPLKGMSQGGGRRSATFRPSE